MLWKPVKNYEGLYEISDAGTVRSKDRKIDTKIRHVSQRIIKGKELKPNLKKNGYFTVDLCKNGKITTTLVHRLVAEAFIPNPHNRKYVNHIDSDRTNNKAANLEWVTSSENRVHGIQYGDVVFRQTKAVFCVEKKMLFEQSKLAAAWVIENFPERTAGQQKVVANNIRRACNGITPKAYGFTWQYHKGSTTIPKGSRNKCSEMGDPLN